MPFVLRYTIHFLFSSLVVALKCWGCISSLKAACGEPFEPKKLHELDNIDCSGSCGKLVYNNTDGE